MYNMKSTNTQRPGIHVQRCLILFVILGISYILFPCNSPNVADKCSAQSTDERFHATIHLASTMVHARFVSLEHPGEGYVDGNVTIDSWGPATSTTVNLKTYLLKCTAKVEPAVLSFIRSGPDVKHFRLRVEIPRETVAEAEFFGNLTGVAELSPESRSFNLNTIAFTAKMERHHNFQVEYSSLEAYLAPGESIEMENVIVNSGNGYENFQLKLVGNEALSESGIVVELDRSYQQVPGFRSAEFDLDIRSSKDTPPGEYSLTVEITGNVTVDGKRVGDSKEVVIDINVNEPERDKEEADLLVIIISGIALGVVVLVGLILMVRKIVLAVMKRRRKNDAP